ncbi:male accessory gland serine protease inhibitor-like [Scaptodrosophila lebanonensis]|uniref:Male accessory gland serine protease inhibitor-like n=1 Tax=Drosophila lebanonensis TaxID=7225 RepID=A0A6J2U815_DROLE|nr:male accessory gland serine protease inhibitor-like [Scaptodrosophila lebanonensis]
MKFLALISVLLALLGLAVGLKDPICGQPHSADGNGVARCMALIPKWTYNAADNQCVEFIYGGCGGNDNRFESQSQCEAKCKN